MNWKSTALDATASRVKWYDRAWCLFLSGEWGVVALVTTDLLSPNNLDCPLIGTPRYLRVVLIPRICSMACFAETNSDP